MCNFLLRKYYEKVIEEKSSAAGKFVSSEMDANDTLNTAISDNLTVDMNDFMDMVYEKAIEDKSSVTWEYIRSKKDMSSMHNGEDGYENPTLDTAILIILLWIRMILLIIFWTKVVPLRILLAPKNLLMMLYVLL